MRADRGDLLDGDNRINQRAAPPAVALRQRDAYQALLGCLFISARGKLRPIRRADAAPSLLRMLRASAYGLRATVNDVPYEPQQASRLPALGQ
jgi:hypothetical protein